MFDQSLYRYESPQPSWWEASITTGERVDAPPLEKSVSCDVVVIGGGYTGLSAAYHLARDFNIDVRVLEAGHIGWGASGRNGGFCCMGGTMLGLSYMSRKYGLDEVRRFFQSQVEAVELVRDLGSEERITFDEVGDGEMVVAEKPAHHKALSEESDFQREMLGIDTRMISQDEFRETQYDSPHQHGAFLQRPGFGLHPLKFCTGLARAALQRGAFLHSKSEATKWHKESGRHVIETVKGGKVIADHVIVACNGFMPEHLHSGISGRAMPLQSQIIVTRQLSDQELEAHKWKTCIPAINSRNVYLYFRMLPGNRFLIGGRADQTGTEKGAQVTAERLHDSFRDLWPEWSPVTIDYSWRGFVCFTSRLRPSIGRLPEDPTVSMAFGYHGNGVSNATWAGRELARWLATGNSKSQIIPTHLPALTRGLTPKFPLPFLRPTIARVGIGWHRFKDMID